jgi:hypothetical protein
VRRFIVIWLHLFIAQQHGIRFLSHPGFTVLPGNFPKQVSACTTNRTSGLSIPIPNALVQTMIFTSLSIQRLAAGCRVLQDANPA